MKIRLLLLVLILFGVQPIAGSAEGFDGAVFLSGLETNVGNVVCFEGLIIRTTEAQADSPSLVTPSASGAQAENELFRLLAAIDNPEDFRVARQVLKTFATRGTARAAISRLVTAKLEEKARFFQAHAWDRLRDRVDIDRHQGFHALTGAVVESKFEQRAGGSLASTPLPLPPGTWIGAGKFSLQFTFNESMDVNSLPIVTWVPASGVAQTAISGYWADDRNYIARIQIPTGQGNTFDGPIKSVKISGAKDLAGNECLDAFSRLLF